MELMGFYNSFQAAQEALISKLLSTMVIQAVNDVGDYTSGSKAPNLCSYICK